MKDHLACNRDIIDSNRPSYYPVIEIATNKVCYYNPEFYNSPSDSLSSEYQLMYNGEHEPLEFSTYSELEKWVEENIQIDYIDAKHFPEITQKSVLKER